MTMMPLGCSSKVCHLGFGGFKPAGLAKNNFMPEMQQTLVWPFIFCSVLEIGVESPSCHFKEPQDSVLSDKF